MKSHTFLSRFKFLKKIEKVVRILLKLKGREDPRILSFIGAIKNSNTYSTLISLIKIL